MSTISQHAQEAVNAIRKAQNPSEMDLLRIVQNAIDKASEPHIKESASTVSVLNEHIEKFNADLKEQKDINARLQNELLKQQAEQNSGTEQPTD